MEESVKKSNEFAGDISDGKTFLGIEAGSTRIKAVLLDSSLRVIATGSAGRENKFENGYWTYSMDEIFSGLRECYSDLKKNVKKSTGVTLKKLSGIGVSAMCTVILRLTVTTICSCRSEPGETRLRVRRRTILQHFTE